MELYFEILLDNGSKYVAAAEDSLNLNIGDYCVIKKDFYMDYGQVVKQTEKPDPQNQQNNDSGMGETYVSKSQEIPHVQRKATVVDQGKTNENSMRAKSALRTTQQFVERLDLPMKLINCHYAFDGKLITIQFSAEGRVDFRELVKQLSQEFNTRIELRQIGVRDETAIIGGIAMCGRPLCCAAFLKDFASINVKMAKEQDLSLTPSTISGICGRLKCCLKYEHEGYLELEAGMPRRGDCCECKEGRGRIIDRNLLTQKVIVQLDDTNRTVTCPKEEVTVIYPEKYKIQKRDRNDGGNGNRDHDRERHNNNGKNHQRNQGGNNGGPKN